VRRAGSLILAGWIFAGVMMIVGHGLSSLRTKTPCSSAVPPELHFPFTFNEHAAVTVVSSAREQAT
jgi:hypothetical protein